MKRDCDKCGKAATVHLTEILEGQKLEKHLCEDCASEEGITVKASLPISQLLEDFILQTGGRGETSELECDVCGMTYSQFRQRGVLGCPNDYDAFEPVLQPMIERAQEGAGVHIGKVPLRAESTQKRHNAILRLRARLRTAVTSEDYEQAAALRDQIQELEEP
ncbi:MAG TPA: UvrB/UvrC motif-containing protein [Phycisphaerae bacterium]|nr:UvrB/UvrC motif-containing protein [Phycisphaerae bacterium]